MATSEHIDLKGDEGVIPGSSLLASSRGDGPSHTDENTGLDDANVVLLDAIIHDGPCGSAIVYQVDEKPVAVSPGKHYLLRPQVLPMMTLAEFNLCTQVALKKKLKEDASEEDAQIEQQNHQNMPRSRGRPDNLRMCFASKFYPLFHTHELQLRSKINPWILGGDPPPKPPLLPQPDNPTEVWIRTANTFAAYYLIVFRPFNEDDIGTMSFTWDALCTFMQQIDQVRQICMSILHIGHSKKL